MRRAIWVLAVLLSHWRRHPMQLATLLIGLISATALWSGVQALNQQARDSPTTARRPTFGGAQHRRCWSAAAAARSRNGSVRRICAAPAGRSPRSCRAASRSAGASLRLLGIEPVTLPTGGRQCAGDRNREGLQVLRHPARTNAGRAVRRSPICIWRKAPRRSHQRRRRAAAAARAAAAGAGRAGGRHRRGASGC